MSFKVDWNKLETDSLRSWTKELLEDALNSGKRPSILASSIRIKDLAFGKEAPEFEILEIGELDNDRFRGIFKISYSGDFHLTLNTKVEGNPLKIYTENSLKQEINSQSDAFVTPNFLLSNNSFNLPLDLKLSDIKISGIGIIVFSKSKGLTLVFKNDPLDSIKVSSTFDTVQVLAQFLQSQIENQIRDLFRETLPTVIHQLSLKYLSKSNSLLDIHNSLLQEEETEDKINFHDIELNHSVNENYINIVRLFNSREKLDLRIPKFKDVIQRSRLEKFNKNMSPSLSNSLQVQNNRCNSNGIPIKLLETNYSDISSTLDKISSIQINNYYKNSNKKPKRRVIKLSKNTTKSSKEESAGPASELSTASSADTLNSINSSDNSTLMSSTNITAVSSPKKKLDGHANSIFGESLVDDKKNNYNNMNKNNNTTSNSTTTTIKQPTPRKKATTDYMKMHLKEFSVSTPSTPVPLIQPQFSRSNTSPINSNSSLLSGLGLGNNYFNFTNTNDHIEKEKLEQEIRRSINYVNVNMNEVVKSTNLKKLQFDEKKRSRKYGNIFMDAPPPYYI